LHLAGNPIAVPVSAASKPHAAAEVYPGDLAVCADP
jgi:hypothetical protein